MKKKCTRKLSSGAIIGVLLFLGCGGMHGQISQTMVLMGTYATVTVVPDSAAGRDAVAEVFSLLRLRERQLSYFDQESELSRINRLAHQAPVVVAEPLGALIDRALTYSVLTDGAFDITVTSLNLPQGFAAIQWDASAGTVHITDPHARIDLGGLTVGYVLDEAARLMRARGQHNFLIDVGGDIYAAGTNAAGKPWRAGIRDPRQHGSLIEYYLLRDKAITTSGNYYKPHIIDPESGVPATGTVLSVTVIAPQAIDADALATAFFVMGIEKTRAFLAAWPDMHAIFAVQEKEKTALVRIN